MRNHATVPTERPRTRQRWRHFNVEGAMLVLSRKVDESLRIGPDIVVTVVRISPDKVRIGITAPRDLNVVRTEIDDHGDDEVEYGGES